MPSIRRTLGAACFWPAGTSSNVAPSTTVPRLARLTEAHSAAWRRSCRDARRSRVERTLSHGSGPPQAHAQIEVGEDGSDAKAQARDGLHDRHLRPGVSDQVPGAS